MSCGSTISANRVPAFDVIATAQPDYPVVQTWIDAAARLIVHVRWLRERQRQRAALMDLDDRLLDDIGVTRKDAIRQGKKPFWR